MLGTDGSSRRHDTQRSGVAGNTHEAERSATPTPRRATRVRRRRRGQVRAGRKFRRAWDVPKVSNTAVQPTLTSCSSVPGASSRKLYIDRTIYFLDLRIPPATRRSRGC
ncbi:hypothetical protein PsYK624_101120 [Phanerochaete sordida]|uniref:Uncharacterized protein n=1 Tax=Phanerochaete sordida TaxID=48140 RepID=A0A9P3GFQ7_9APHY|nr:hypothetical protein PsYK624_101120 [Phanerochaete sordida]